MTYTVTVDCYYEWRTLLRYGWRKRRSYALTIYDIDGSYIAYTEARSFIEIDVMARDCISLMRDVSTDFDIDYVIPAEAFIEISDREARTLSNVKTRESIRRGLEQVNNGQLTPYVPRREVGTKPHDICR